MFGEEASPHTGSRNPHSSRTDFSLSFLVLMGVAEISTPGLFAHAPLMRFENTSSTQVLVFLTSSSFSGLPTCQLITGQRLKKNELQTTTMY
jgi:hypothetical protein